MGAQEHAGTSRRRSETVRWAKRRRIFSWPEPHAVLPALSPDGRTSERSFQVTQDILEQAGILKKRTPTPSSSPTSF